MLKVNGSAKAHTSVIPEQEVGTHSSHEESASSDHESESEISYHPSRPQAPNPSSKATNVHAVHRGTQNGLDS